MKNDKDNFSRFLAIVSIILSTIALYQTSHHDSMSLMPLLDFNNNTEDRDSEIGLSIENEGLGPAIIKSIGIFVDNKQVKNWEEATEACHLKNPEEVVWYELDKGNSIKVGE